MVKPTLVILDGTMTMMTNGPTGGSLSDLKPTNTMIVSTDQVAADAFGATLLGRTAGDLPYFTRRKLRGWGRRTMNRSVHPGAGGLSGCQRIEEHLSPRNTRNTRKMREVRNDREVIFSV